VFYEAINQPSSELSFGEIGEEAIDETKSKIFFILWLRKTIGNP
jgi:hypothetical protein